MENDRRQGFQRISGMRDQGSPNCVIKIHKNLQWVPGICSIACCQSFLFSLPRMILSCVRTRIQETRSFQNGKDRSLLLHVFIHHDNDSYKIFAPDHSHPLIHMIACVGTSGPISEMVMTGSFIPTRRYGSRHLRPDQIDATWRV